MEANILLHHRCSSKSATPILILNQHSPPFTTQLPLRRAFSRSKPLKTTRPTTTITTSSSSGEDGNRIPSSTPQPAIPPTDTVEIRFRRGSRRRSRDLQMDNNGGGSGNIKTKNKSPPKKWEDMSYGEKAMELYVGEKGLLFWLNKFAYASIFIIIGAWILFRFVGPSLGLYELDTPPLSPSKLLK